MFSKEYERFNNLIKNKNILCIPIYSMFDHQTHICNLACDGNVNRLITTFYKINDWKSLVIFCPDDNNSINGSWLFDGLKEDIVDESHYLWIFRDSEFKNHAAYMRESEFANNFYNRLRTIYEPQYYESDFIMFEGQDIGLKLLENKIENKKYIYWCPVCATNDKTRSFLETNKEKDKKLFELSDYIILASKNQLEYVKSLGYGDKIFLLDQISSRDVPFLSKYKKDENISAFLEYLYLHDEKVIYLPFRISDEGYKAKSILDILYEFQKDKKIHFVILYPNPNNDNLLEKWSKNSIDKELFIKTITFKINENKNTYFTLLDNNQVVIPYFEDVNFIMHGTYNELQSENTLANVIYDIDIFKKYIKSNF